MSLSQKMFCIGIGVAFGGSLYAGYVADPTVIIRYFIPTGIWLIFWACVEDE